MLKLDCKAQNYAWGKVGMESIVAQIHDTHHPEEKEETVKLPFAEYWMGDHPNGPSKINIDKSDEYMCKIVKND